MSSLDRRAFIGASATGFALAAAPAVAAPPIVQEIGSVRRLDPEMDEIVAPDARVTQVVRGFTWCEGPCWVPALDALIFSDVPANTAFRWSRTRGLSIWMKPSGWQGAPDAALREAGSNGWTLDEHERLIMANSGGRCLERVDPLTRARTVLADRYRGKRFNSVNDAVVGAKGAIYFTDPPYGLIDGDRSPVKELAFNGVYRWSLEGGVTLIDDALTFPNGIGLSPDERTLYVSVSDPTAPKVYAWDLDRQGKAGNRRVFFDATPLMGDGVKGLPDGLTVAPDGRLFVAGPGGLMVLTAAARLIGVISVNDRPVSNCVFGEDGKTLFMTADDLVAMVRVRHRTA